MGQEFNRRHLLKTSAGGLLPLTRPASVKHQTKQEDTPNTLEVTKEGTEDGEAEFEVTVSGDLEVTDSFEEDGRDTVNGNTATGVVGPEGGTDKLQYSGEITDFSLDGPATVYRNGNEVGPEDLPGWDINIKRITPVDDEVTVAHGPVILFEASVTNCSVNSRDQWFIDGERPIGSQYPYISPNHHLKLTDVSEGEHDIQCVVYGEDEEEQLGSISWSIHVEEDANEAPSVERVSPTESEVEFTEGETFDLTVEATDPDGDLHRSIWFLGVTDASMGAMEINGSRDRASITYEPQDHLPVVTWAVDERGLMNTSRLFDTLSWIFKEGDGPSNSLRITKEGAEDGVAEYEVTVSGELEAGESFESGGTDSIDGDTASGRIGPEGGSDEVRYSGEITDFSLDGPATVYHNGEEVDPDEPDADDGDSFPNTLRITKEGAEDGVANYEMAVSEDIEAGESFEDGGTDSISGNTASGRVGPERGSDSVNYSGEITEFSLDGPATVYRNDEEVDPDELGTDDGNSNDGDDSENHPNTLRITKEGAEDGVANYEVTVDGDLEAGESFESGGTDSIDGNTASGRVGPEGGSDSVNHSGEITEFSLDGPAVVYRNGEQVDPEELGGGRSQLQ